MTLKAVTDRIEVSSAFDLLRDALRDRGVAMKHTVGYQGGSEDQEIVWHAHQGIWSLTIQVANNYWCAFGMADPDREGMLNITCEINPPLSGESLSHAGRFARDEHDSLYLTHSGRIGGGFPGVGREAFMAFHKQGKLETITWPRRASTKVYRVAALESPGLIDDIADYVRVVDAFKRAVRRAAAERRAAS